MRYSSSLLLKVISKFASENSENRKRYYNLMSFLGINPEGTQEKEASDKEAARVPREVQNSLRDWLFDDILQDRLPPGYFSPKNRATYSWRQDVYTFAPKMLFDKLSVALFSKIGAKIKQTLGRDVGLNKLSIEDNAIYDKVADMVMEMINDPSFFNQTVNRWKKAVGSKEEEVSPDAEAPEGGRGFQRYKPGLAEFWFAPRVTDEVYNKYKEFIEKEKDGKLKNLAEKIKAKTGKDLNPAHLGIFRDKIDSTAFDILKKLGKFNLKIWDADITVDTKENKDTWQVEFSIPELAEKMPTIYGDVTYRTKIPPTVRYLDPADEVPVSVQHSYETKSGKNGMYIRLDKTFEDWSEDTLETFENVGFISKGNFEKFIDSMSSEYIQDRYFKGKDLNEILQDLGQSGGDLEVYGKSVASVEDIAEAVTQAEGDSLTKEDISNKRYLGDFEKRRQTLRDLIDKAVDSTSERIYEYQSSLDKTNAAKMKDAILKEYAKDKAGTKNFSMTGVLTNPSAVSFILDLIFSPQVDPGSSAWKSILKEHLSTEVGNKNSEVYKQAYIGVSAEKLKSMGLSQQGIFKKLMEISQGSISNPIVTSEEVLKGFSEFLSSSTYKVTLKRLEDNLREIITDRLNTHPAFEKFWERRRTWDSATKANIENKVERILAGDDALPGMRNLPSNTQAVLKQVIAPVEVPTEERVPKKDEDGNVIPDEFEYEKKTRKENRIDPKALLGLNPSEVVSLVDGIVQHFSDEATRRYYKKSASNYQGVLKLAFSKIN